MIGSKMHYTGWAQQPKAPTIWTPDKASTAKYVWLRAATLGAAASAMASWTNDANPSNTPTSAGSYRPIVDTVVGGSKCALFDGVDDGLTFPSNITAINTSSFIVVQPTTIAAVNYCIYAFQNISAFTCNGTTWGEFGASGSGAASLVAGNLYLLEIHNNASSVDLIQNGTLVNRAGTIGLYGRSGSAIGHDPSGQAVQSGPFRLVELFICGVLTSAAERVKARRYFLDAFLSPDRITATKRIWAHGADLGGQSSAIASWTNRANAGNAAAQATPGQQPTVDTVSGDKCALFDGIDDQLNFPTNVTTTTPSMMVVVTPASIAGYQCVLCTGNVALYGSEGGAAWGVVLNLIIGETTLTPGTRYLLEAHINVAYGDVDLVRNGTTVNKTTGSGPHLTGGTALGVDVANFYRLSGRMFEAFVSDHLSTAERAMVRGYFNGYYSIF